MVKCDSLLFSLTPGEAWQSDVARVSTKSGWLKADTATAAA
jgi:hypothetical protein